MTFECLLHEGESGRFVAFPGDEAFQDLALVVHRSPQVMHLAIDLYVHLIEMPLPVSEAPHPGDTLAADVRSKKRTEAVPPQPHRLMAEVNAALKQQVLNVAQAQREPDIHHDDKPDYLRRGVEIAKGTGDFGVAHARLLPARGSTGHPFDSTLDSNMPRQALERVFVEMSVSLASVCNVGFDAGHDQDKHTRS